MKMFEVFWSGKLGHPVLRLGTDNFFDRLYEKEAMGLAWGGEGSKSTISDPQPTAMICANWQLRGLLAKLQLEVTYLTSDDLIFPQVEPDQI